MKLALTECSTLEILNDRRYVFNDCTTEVQGGTLSVAQLSRREMTGEAVYRPDPFYSPENIV